MSHSLAITGEAPRIGPNTIIRTVQALRELHGDTAAQAVLTQIGKPDYFEYTADSLIEERLFTELYHDLIEQIGMAETQRVLERAGRLTALYVLGNRIPGFVRVLLRILPRTLALRMLLDALGRYAWTFTGSGQYTYRIGRPSTITLASSPTARDIRSATPCCTFYRAAFEQLLQVLIDPHIHIHEAACSACGAERCTFVIG